MKVKSESEVTQSCPTLSDPMDCSLPGSSIHGILQAKVLDWGAVAFSDLFLLIRVKNFLLSRFVHHKVTNGFPGGIVVKNLPANAGDARNTSLTPGSGRSVEEEMATHPSILAIVPVKVYQPAVNKGSPVTRGY